MTRKQMEAAASPTAAWIDGALLSTSAGTELQIPAREWLMWRREGLGRISGEREEWWCVEFEERRAPFIATRRGRGAMMKSSMATRLQRRSGTGDDARGQATSWR
jgi:hypothetical protein